MDIVLGVSMTPTTVRMVLVEGENADGITVDHDVFDVTAVEDAATMSAADQVVAAILGTQESADAGGHHLKSIGVTWSDHSDASALRDSLTAHGIDDVMLVSEGHAAAALAQAVGRAVGYDTTALLFIDRDAATLSVVQTEDGSVVKVLGSSLHSTDAMAVLSDMAAAVAAQETPPDGMFIVGSGVDVSSVKEHLQHLVSMPVNAPEEPELALARGAALASATAPALEASTVGLAYSQDPDGPTAGSAYALAGLDTQLAPAGSDLGSLVDGGVDELDPAVFNEVAAADEERKPFLLVGSALTSVFVIGVVALVISLAVSIRPTVDQRPAPAQGAVVPTAPVAKAPAPAPAPEAKPVQEAPPPAPPPETIKAPVPVVQEAPQPQAPPRTVYVEQPQAPAPAPAAPPPAPEAPPPAPVAPVLPAPAPVYQPPGYIPPVVVLPRVPSIFRPPWEPQRPPQQNPWNPPWDPPKQAPKPQWPGSGPGGWDPGPGRGSDNGPGRGGGDNDWNPGRGSGGPGRGDSGNSGWNPGSGGGRNGGGGGHNGGGHNGGGPVWPFPFGGGHH
ncbi:DUF7159 family protein [Mycolicibacterium smegmatis]|uniref:DUF7159 family protein n=1 Tax=Mycolicibacterium smegmatis TaxID=1772 RepID=UPI0005D87596|nr:hypothetical protein [Mycolicibacterium smegmatis]MCP2628389.1 hypothetical protein [Mycolicibacterium smegmatis]MDF1902494.1 hypothetical protein [Mycolicibacterium smegmatis]MDF1908787.1 hypothetical protein [Mycolicibacterium smegmatis]MDF1919181.1 hypothetical protein [Mycolicibacterium smegmatis]MDF1927353.1 hypothetical protein [Mycolicibacterium smegmatis]